MEEIEQRLARIVDIVEGRAVRLDAIDQRISLLADRMNAAEQTLSVLLAEHDAHVKITKQTSKNSQLLLTLLMGAIGISLTAVGLTITVLVVLLNHIIGK